ncbi:MAG: potassium channel family protein [Salinivirgaceae bacterium]|nr:potassium channel family protein [Salinivirgaceae bacterium]
MRIKLSTGKLYWLFAVLYFVLLFLLVQVEKKDPNANIKTFYDGIWYSVVTLTTVGYGDYYPVSALGKILGLVVIFSSLGVLGFLIGNFTNIIRNRMEKKKRGFFGTDFSNHFVIIGWDSFAKNVADQIVNANCNIAVVTNNNTDLELIKDMYPEKRVFVLLADFENHEALLKVNIQGSNSVFVNFSDDTKSLIYIINLKKQYNVNVVVALQTSELKETFQTVGVNYIVSKNDITSKLVASYIFEPDVAAFTEDLIETSVKENDFDMHEFKIIESNPFLEVNYFDAFVKLKKEYNCVLVGITKIIDGQRTLIKNPTEDLNIEINDYILIIAGANFKKKIEDDFGVKEGVIN